MGLENIFFWFILNVLKGKDNMIFFFNLNVFEDMLFHVAGRSL